MASARVIEALAIEGGLILRIALLGLFAALQIGSADPRVGTWTLSSAQSSLTPPNKLSITPEKDQEHVVMSGEKRIDFTANSNGHETAVAGNPMFDQIELHRVSRTHVEVKEKKAGAVAATIDDKLSKDGDELTVTTATVGQPTQVTVWVRSGGVRVAKDPFAGEWTQDMSKTRMRQGLTLNIQPDGTNGVRFSGGFSYTARFDGKTYDLQNSRNDTVQLSRVDAHTVDALYRRDGQMTEKAHWVVSADGREMTETDAGTLETGQHIVENLVFHKQ
ncbi:MAG: hypothetical protein WB439_15120 [Acidobacteriaceae bacterium]